MYTVHIKPCVASVNSPVELLYNQQLKIFRVKIHPNNLQVLSSSSFLSKTDSDITRLFESNSAVWIRNYCTRLE